MEYTNLEKLAKEAGFTHTAFLDPRTIVLRTEVRQMCAACGQYDKRWSCPPGCGSLEACEERLGGYDKGILLQTVGQLEDEFDGEGMMDIETRHKACFAEFCKMLAGKDILSIGAGCCTICRDCTYPDAPCRFPERMVSSMEAYGMVVADVCRDNGLPYYYGRNTIAYTCCLLYR